MFYISSFYTGPAGPVKNIGCGMMVGVETGPICEIQGVISGNHYSVSLEIITLVMCLKHKSQIQRQTNLLSKMWYKNHNAKSASKSNV